MTDQPASWPPIITHARVPRYVVWRDRLLTIAMWFLLFVLIADAIPETWDDALDLMASELWWERLRPYFIVTAVLGVWLVFWGIATVRRVRRNRGKPPPLPLTPGEQARDAGCSEEELVAWRTLRFARVHVAQDGRITVEPIDPRPTA